MHEFFLSTETALRLGATSAAPPQRWMQVAHTGIARPALILLAGEHVECIDEVSVLAGTRVLLRYGAAHDALSADGAELLLELHDDGAAITLARLSVPPDPSGLPPRTAIIDLTPFAGRTCRLRLSCLPGPAQDPGGDWIAIYDLAVGSEEHLPRMRARAFRAERTRNEIEHFSNVYQHGIYTSPTDAGAGPRADVTCVPVSELVRHARDPVRLAESSPHLAYPAPGELPAPTPANAFDYAHRLLGAALQSRPPRFQSRLIELCADIRTRHGRPARILSLCSGAARFEAQFAASAGKDAEWTLLDISEGLLRTASHHFPEDNRPRLILGDLNDVEDFGERYDVVMCISALHHIIELERVADFIQQVLVDQGEFWSIGEAIGRSGNRLWQHEYAAANGFFRSLPERLRRNRLSGTADADLPNTDYSEATFEGIRSDEIEPLLSHRLEPVHLYRRNCFLWRLVDLAYADNYDLSRDEDLAWIQAAVTAELAHYRAGGRPTELHGVFRKRVL